MSTLPAPRPELQAPPTNPAFGGIPTPPLAGATTGFGSDFQDFLKGTEGTDPMLRALMFQNYLNQKNREQDKRDAPELIRAISDAQFENAQRSQQLGMQSNIFGGLLKTVTDLPGKVIAARHMYGPEEATNYTRGLQSFGSVNVPTYFNR